MNKRGEPVKEAARCSFCAHSCLVHTVRDQVRVNRPQSRRNFLPPECAMLRAEAAAALRGLPRSKSAPILSCESWINFTRWRKMGHIG